MKIQIYGDSVLRGVVLDDTTNKYCISDGIGIEALEKKYNCSIENLSKFGYTISKGIRLIKSAVRKGDFAIVEYGGNDSDFDWKKISDDPEKEHFSNTTLQEFKNDYKEIIEFLRGNGTEPILATLPPIEADRYFAWFSKNLNKENILKWLGDTSAIFRYQQKYSQAVAEIAKEMHCRCVDIRSIFEKSKNPGEYMCTDGIHPNAPGQQLIHNALDSILCSL